MICNKLKTPPLSLLSLLSLFTLFLTIGIAVGTNHSEEGTYGGGSYGGSAYGIYRPGDLNNDGKVDIFDLAVVGKGFGLSTGDAGFDPRADTNGDGILNIYDLAYVGRNFGKAY